MYYKNDFNGIKENLRNYLTAEAVKAGALIYFLDFLSSYKSDTINNRIKTKLEESKTYSQEITDWQDKKIKKEFPLYSMSYEKDFSKRVNFYFYKKAFDNQENKETFYFSGGIEFTVKELKKQINERIKGINEKIEKVKTEYNKITKIYANYNDIREKLDKMEDSISYITLDQLNKQDYTIKNYK
jgi:F0F1-type ATP synthase membrane subunit b/b'